MEPILYSKSQRMPSEINNIIFDFAGSNNFYAINWVCRNWQKDLLEERVFRVIKDLCSIGLDETFAFALDPKNKKNGALKLLSLNLFNHDGYLKNEVDIFVNKVCISCFTSSLPYRFEFSFTDGNIQLPISKDETYFKLLSCFNFISIKKSYKREGPDQSIKAVTLIETDMFQFKVFKENDFLKLRNLYERTLAYISSLITPEFNRTPEPITSFKHFFADRVFRIQEYCLT